jgi:hypothetical protein
VTHNEVREAATRLGRVAGALSQAEGELTAALGLLQELREEISALVATRLQRSWIPEEFTRYLALTGDERRAHRRYLAARQWYEAAFRRIRAVDASLTEG